MTLRSRTVNSFKTSQNVTHAAHVLGIYLRCTRDMWSHTRWDKVDKIGELFFKGDLKGSFRMRPSISGLNDMNNIYKNRIIFFSIAYLRPQYITSKLHTNISRTHADPYYIGPFYWHFSCDLDATPQTVHMHSNSCTCPSRTVRALRPATRFAH